MLDSKFPISEILERKYRAKDRKVPCAMAVSYRRPRDIAPADVDHKWSDDVGRGNSRSR